VDWLRRERHDVKDGRVGYGGGNHGQSLAFAEAKFGIRV